MSRVGKAVVVAAIVVSALLAPRPAVAYSVLAHEANIDALWDSTIAPMLRARFPDARPEQILDARGYAYGGCVIQDLGYYPFGSHFFSNLLHYVRTGDFIQALIADAGDVNEYAFALGALGHYSADNQGHALAVNPAVAMMYPKLKKQFGNRVTYAQSPKNHIMVEFGFDVVQVAAAAYAPEAYHTFIGFHEQATARARLQRDMRHRDEGRLLEEDLAIGTYRHAVATTIPEMTKVAWEKARRDQKVVPGAKERVVFNLRRGRREEIRRDYENRTGSRFLSGSTCSSKIGPFRAFKFSVPTADTNVSSSTASPAPEHFKQSLDAECRPPEPCQHGLRHRQADHARRASMADETHDELLGSSLIKQFSVSESLRLNLVSHSTETSTRIPW
jgi:hypothetical protein